MDLQSIETDYIGLKELLDYLHGEDNIVKNKDANHAYRTARKVE